MPRDLLAERKVLDDMAELSREPASLYDNSSLVPHRESNIMKQERLKKSGIHPFAQLLNLHDLDDCDWLEHAAFDPIEAATREKVRTVSFVLPCCPLLPPSEGICVFVTQSGLNGRHQCALLHCVHETVVRFRHSHSLRTASQGLQRLNLESCRSFPIRLFVQPLPRASQA